RQLFWQLWGDHRDRDCVAEPSLFAARQGATHERARMELRGGSVIMNTMMRARANCGFRAGLLAIWSSFGCSGAPVPPVATDEVSNDGGGALGVVGNAATVAGASTCGSSVDGGPEAAWAQDASSQPSKADAPGATSKADA